MKKFLLALVLIVPMLAFVGCGGDDDEPQDVSVPDQSLLVDQTYTLPKGTWVSSDDIIAKVEGNKVVAVRRGEAIIKSGAKSFKVTVTPSNNIIPDPCLQFGAKQNVVSDYMEGIGGFDKPGLSLSMTYVSSKPYILGYQYMFKNYEGLQSVTIMAFQKEIPELEIAEYLKQRYVPVMEKDGVFGFLSPDKKITVAFTMEVIKGDVTYLIQYTPN